ncbi:hypothetical protein DRB96_41410 [Streptomyces sp. ICC1]|nr:hypothetical protein DRB96_41410 [Streptomyces sp. ICC1]
MRRPGRTGRPGRTARRDRPGRSGAGCRGEAQTANRVLGRAVRVRGAGGGGDGQARVAGALGEGRRTVEALDPSESAGSSTKGVRKFVSKLPGGNKCRDHVAKYASSQATLSRVVGALRGGQDELRRDSAALHTGAGGGAHRPDRSPIPPRSPVSGAVPVPADPTALPGNGARVVTRPAEQAAGGAAGTADREGGAGGTGGSHGR